MFDPHDLVDTPPDNCIVWRYMDLERFISLVATSKLVLVPTTAFDDPWEGVFPKTFVNALRQNSPCAEPGLMQSSLRLKEMTFVSCWHETPHESAGLWAQYGKSAGLAIKSSIWRIKQGLKTDVDFHIGRVRYIDHEEHKLSEANVMESFFLKRLPFKHEQEVRILVSHLFERGKSKEAWDAPTPSVYALPADLSELIDSVLLSPSAPTWLNDALRILLDKFGLEHLKLGQSTMLTPFVYWPDEA